MIKQLAASVTAQAATEETLSTKMNDGSSGSRKTTDKNKERPGLHVLANCKHKVHQKDGNCLALEVNKAKC